MTNFDAFSEAVTDTDPLAIAVQRALDGKFLICRGRHVPPKWLWHGGRLLPALIWDAAKHGNFADRAIATFRTPSRGEYAYLPRGFYGDIRPVRNECIEALKRLMMTVEVEGIGVDRLEKVRADNLILQFMEDVIQTGGQCDDPWNWLLFKAVGGVPVIPFDPIPEDWAEFGGFQQP